MRTAACLFVLAACGGSSTAPKTATNSAAGSGTPPTTATQTPAAPPSVRQVCDRVEELQHEQCGAFGKTINVTPMQCNSMFGDPIADPAEAKFRDKTALCVVKTDCQQVSDCLADLSNPDPADLRECSTPGPNAVGIPSAEYAQRNGSRAKTFKQAASTKEAPIERCGIENANEWLSTLRCGDGSVPIKDHPDAETFRVGNVGKAGRCGSIVDHYQVPCPEGPTDIYIDAYVCPK